MRRIDLLLAATACLALAGGYATVAETSVWARTMLGLPLAVLLPGYALSRITFGLRLRHEQRLLVSLALSLALDALGGIGLSLSPWGITTRSWAIALTGITLAFVVVAAIIGPVLPASQLRWRLSWAGTLISLTALACACVVVAVIAASRQPSDPPPWARGYTLLWLVPKSSGQVEVGVQSGEFSDARYRIVLRRRDQPALRWDTDRVRPAGTWSRTVSVGKGARIDAFLYRSGDPRRVYRHVYLTASGDAPA